MPGVASPKIFLSAGEASGEHYGALLMAEIAAWRRKLSSLAWEARVWRAWDCAGWCAPKMSP